MEQSMSQPTYKAVTILSGATTASAYETKGATRGSFQLPAAFTGVAMTVNVSNDTSLSWVACPVEGNEANPITVAQGKAYSLPVKCFSFRYVQLVSGSAEGADRTIQFCTRD